MKGKFAKTGTSARNIHFMSQIENPRLHLHGFYLNVKTAGPTQQTISKVKLCSILFQLEDCQVLLLTFPSLRYEEYRQFCRENQKPVPDLQINLTENQLV